MNQPLRVAVASFAHVHATSYLRLLARMPGVEVLASDPDGHEDPGQGPRGRALAREWGIEYVDGYDELFDRRPDAVVITSENARHRALTERAAAAGAHVLCEKPLATTVSDGEAMIAACDAAGAILMVAHPVRHSPAFRAARALHADGALGATLAIQGTNTGMLPRERAWFVDPDLAGGGALVDHIVHCADLIDDLTGGRRARSVYAVGNGRLHPDDAFPVETAGLATIVYEDGLSATIDCSWSEPTNAPTWGGLTLRLIGAHGTIDIDPFRDRIGGTDAAGEVHIGVGADLDELMLASFLAAVRRTGRAEAGRAPEDPPQPDGAAGLRSLRIIDAARRSAVSGTVQPVSG